jgi:hypothetical protein
MAFTIHSSKDGTRIQTMRLSPASAVARARGLSKAGWQVHITDTDGREFRPESFDELLSVDRSEPAGYRAQRFF